MTTRWHATFVLLATAGLVSAAGAAPTTDAATSDRVARGAAGRVAREHAVGRASKSAATSRPTARPAGYDARPDVLAFVDALVAHDGFDRDALLRLFARARYSETSARLMTPAAVAATGRDWNAYRARFVEPVRLAAGFAFWDDNAAVLARAERDYGVPAEIVVGILGCETVYGRNTGSLRVLDTLSTLSFDFPSGGRDRSAFFREQLADALAMARDGAIDLDTLRGSYAGAIGMPQFMPGSIRQYAVDYDGDGRIDLVASPADVVGSVAHYLAAHGWVRDMPTHVALTHPTPFVGGDAARIDAMVGAGSVPSLAFGDLVDAGFVATSLPPTGPLALIDLPSGRDASGAPSTAYVAGTQNFHVITRYNRSYFYAMSVIELGASIKALRDAQRAGRSDAVSRGDEAGRSGNAVRSSVAAPGPDAPDAVVR